jgi:hypothetical protein
MPWWYMGEWRYSSIILELGIRRSWVDIFTRRPIYPRGKFPQYPLYRTVGGPHSRSGRYGETKHFACAGNRTQAVQAVAYRYTDLAIPT